MVHVVWNVYHCFSPAQWLECGRSSSSSRSIQSPFLIHWEWLSNKNPNQKHPFQFWPQTSSHYKHNRIMYDVCIMYQWIYNASRIPNLDIHHTHIGMYYVTLVLEHVECTNILNFSSLTVKNQHVLHAKSGTFQHCSIQLVRIHSINK